MAARWTPIPGFGRYEASDDGRIRVRKTGRQLQFQAPSLHRKYHMVVLVDDNGIRKNTYVHRIIYEAFEGPTDLVGFKDSSARWKLALSNLVSIPAKVCADGKMRPKHSNWKKRMLEAETLTELRLRA